MQIFKQFFVGFLVLVSLQSGAFAADLAGIKTLFEKTFWTSHYVEGQCGKNIIGLVEKAYELGLDLHGAEILEITDEGGWMFGMVNALQARQGGRKIEPQPVKPPYRHPGEKNWYYHAVLLVDGYVLDYDFTNFPKVVTAMEYFHQMFVPADKQKDADYKQRKMRLYKLIRYDAEDYILRRRQRISTSDLGVEQKLRDYMPGFFVSR